jgi:hypothetical protein
VTGEKKAAVESHLLLLHRAASAKREAAKLVSHTPFWQKRERSGQNQGEPLERGKNDTDFSAHAAWTAAAKSKLSSPLVQASAPRPVRSLPASATLGKPLRRESLFYRCIQFLWKPSGSGLCVAREPRLPRIHALQLPFDVYHTGVY